MSGRAKILLLLSLIFFLSGIALFSLPIPAAALAADPTLHAHLRLMSVNQIAWLFTLVGGFGVLTSLFKRLITWGYSALMFVNMFWFLLYMLSWAETGYWRTIFAAAQSGLIIGTLWIASNIVEFPKPLASLIHEEHTK